MIVFSYLSGNRSARNVLPNPGSEVVAYERNSKYQAKNTLYKRNCANNSLNIVRLFVDLKTEHSKVDKLN